MHNAALYSWARRYHIPENGEAIGAVGMHGDENHSPDTEGVIYEKNPFPCNHSSHCRPSGRCSFSVSTQNVTDVNPAER
jgi:hypothetical protein